MIQLSLHLYHKPGGDSGKEGEEVTATEVVDFLTGMASKLAAKAAIVQKLGKDGWEMQMRLFDLSVTHPEVTTKREAKARLKALDIDPKAVQIEEFEDE